MRIFDLAIKDILQIVRDKRSLFFLLAMPAIFTLFMGFAYRSGSNSDASKDTRIPLGWVNNDPDGQISQRLLQMLSSSDAVRLVKLAPAAADVSLQKGEVAGVLIVPTGYSEQIMAGKLAQFTLQTNPGSTQGQSLIQLIRTPITQLLSSVEIARLSAEAVGQSGDTGEISQGFTAASQAWSQTDTSGLIKVEMAVKKKSTEWYGNSPYNQASPGMIVMFAIFGLMTTGQILVQERKSRTLQRMVSTSMRPWEIVAGHTLGMFALVFVQVMLLVVFGQLALGVNYASDPLGTLIVCIGLSLWIASMGLLVGVMVRDDSQVVVFSMMAMFLFSALGGVWFPLEATRGAFATLGRLMPSAFAMSGFQNILIRGLGMESVWIPAGMLFLYALVFFGVAVWLFRKIES